MTGVASALAMGPASRHAGLTVVVPTLNEAPNILAFLREVEARLPGCTVLLADDDSKDDTRLLAERYRGGIRVEVLHRRTADTGLTASVTDGILAVRTPRIVVMDADLQHPADLLPRLDEALAESDVVVASRTDDASFSWRRRLLSRGARVLARHHLRRRTGLDVKDAMSGYFAVRTDVAQEIVRRSGARFERPGFKVLMDLLLHARPGVRVGSVPYAFRSRHAGASKLVARHYLSFLRQLGRTGRLVASFFEVLLSGVLPRFLAVGATGVVVNEGLLYAGVEVLALPLALAAAAAVEASVLWNFAWNDAWTFRGRGHRPLGVRLARFHVASAAGMVLNVGVLVAGAWLLPGLSYLVVNLAGIALASGVNFVVNLHWTWGRAPDEVAPDDAQE